MLTWTTLRARGDFSSTLTWTLILYPSSMFPEVSPSVGFYALYPNGISYRTSFSTIVAAIRNHVLDDVVAGSSLGADPMGQDAMQTRLKFGILDQGRGVLIETDRKGPGCRRTGLALESQLQLPRKMRRKCI
jgi:hypothetical protein